jgi:polyhydroxybutyrate depolymerase
MSSVERRSRPSPLLATLLAAVVLVTAGCNGTAGELATASAAGRTSLPAEATTSPAEPTELDVSVGDDVRHVRVFVPEPVPTTPRPLVVFLHAAGATPAGAVAETGLDRLARTDGAIVAFPPAYDRRWAAQVTPGLSDSDVDEAYLSGLLDQLVERYPVDPDRVFVAGFSMGAVMAGRLACRLADRIAAVAIVSGTPWVGACAPSRPVSVLIVHGTGDSTFRIGPAEALARAWRDRDGCASAASPRAIGDDATLVSADTCDEGTVVDFVTIANGPHAWFSSPDASELAWQFFVDHPRR